MTTRLGLAFALLLGLMPHARAQASENGGIARLGLYVVSDDLGRARAFYESLFADKARMVTDKIVTFDVAGGLYAIVSRQAYAPDMVRGNSTIPYISVKDIDRMFARVKKLAPAAVQGDAVIDEGPFRFFKVVDPDGNVIEFFAITPPPAGP